MAKKPGAADAVPFTREELECITRLFDDGLSSVQVAAQFGISGNQFRWRVTNSGYNVRLQRVYRLFRRGPRDVGEQFIRPGGLTAPAGVVGTTEVVGA